MDDAPMTDGPKRSKFTWRNIKYQITYWFEKLVSLIANALYDWTSNRMISWYKPGTTLVRKKPLNDEADKVIVSEIHGQPYYQIHYLDMVGALHKSDVGQVFDQYEEL